MKYNNFFSNRTNTTMQQITKPVAKRLFHDGVEIFLNSSNMGFDHFWQSAMSLQKNAGYNGNRTFEQITNEFIYYNCDNERGKYICFFVRVDDLKKK